MKRLVAGVIATLLVTVLAFTWARSSSQFRRPTNNFRLPVATTTWGLYSGHEFLETTDAFKLGYVAGVYDAFVAVLSEVLVWRDAIRDTSQVFEEVGVPSEARLDLESVAANGTIAKLETLLLSMPGDIAINRLWAVVFPYIEDHPNDQDIDAALLVWRALAEAEWK